MAAGCREKSAFGAIAETVAKRRAERAKKTAARSEPSGRSPSREAPVQHHDAGTSERLEAPRRAAG